MSADIPPGLVRRCGWPGCDNTYNTATGPAENGWTRRLSCFLTICSQHDVDAHDPGFNQARREGTCSCGARGQVEPWSAGAVLAWWTTHVAEAAT